MNDFNSSATAFAYPPSYPGYTLQVGSRGSDVSIMQSYLNAIGLSKYPTITKLSVDGIFGDMTKEAVMQYQAAAGLTIDGIIGPRTWASIVSTYDSLPVADKDTYPGYLLREGSQGAAVENMQAKLNRLAAVYEAINTQTEDGKFGPNMENAVKRFQRQFSLTVDGIIGKATWDKIVLAFDGLMDNECMRVSPVYSGTQMSKGSQSEDVRLVQSYLNGLSIRCPGVCLPLTVDGMYGEGTKQSVSRFQSNNNLSVDGIVGKATWDKIIKEFNNAILD